MRTVVCVVLLAVLTGSDFYKKETGRSSLSANPCVKDLTKVKWAFRTSKAVEIELRPINVSKKRR